MRRVIAALVRHGDYEQPDGVPSAHLPHPLTARGEHQSHAVAGELAAFAAATDWSIDDIVETSRMLRAWQTGKIIADELSTHYDQRFRVRESSDLAERGLGAAANLSTEQIASILRADPRHGPPPEGWKRDSFYKLPLQGAESFLEAGARVGRYLELRLRELGNEVTADTLKVFVGHGGSFRYASVHLGVLELEQARGLSMHHCRPVYLERLANGRWMQVGGDWRQRNRQPERLD
jgi:2,3-bisphosphoglycerate-dependent phosphoglycerate mutase